MFRRRPAESIAMQVFVFLIAAFVLAYQIVLMRMFSIAQWHHFAAMIISIALLGFGLSGVLLQSPLARRGSRWLQTAAGRVVLAFLVVVLGLGSAWIALWIPFTPVLIAWQPRQLIL